MQAAGQYQENVVVLFVRRKQDLSGIDITPIAFLQQVLDVIRCDTMEQFEACE
jgi:hypothetical protein